jgi:hypothetical protein
MGLLASRLELNPEGCFLLIRLVRLDDDTGFGLRHDQCSDQIVEFSAEIAIFFLSSNGTNR